MTVAVRKSVIVKVGQGQLMCFFVESCSSQLFPTDSAVTLINVVWFLVESGLSFENKNLSSGS